LGFTELPYTSGRKGHFLPWRNLEEKLKEGVDKLKACLEERESQIHFLMKRLESQKL